MATLSIEDFHEATTDGHRLPFGVSAVKTAGALVGLAAKISNGAATVRSVTVEKATAAEEFAVTTLSIRFFERVG